jgi:hypothetical protein
MRVNPLQRACASLGGQPLNNAQKRDAILLMIEAWPGSPEEEKEKSADAFTAWRREQTALACGHSHLTACQQRHLPAIMAHFARLAGKPSVARYWEERAIMGDGARQARSLLDRAIREAADVIAKGEEYAASICRTRFKCGLEDCSQRQLMMLVFDVRRNAQRRRAKGAYNKPLTVLQGGVPA